MEENLQSHLEKVNHICSLIENGEEYKEELASYLPLLNRIIKSILTCTRNPEIDFMINEQFVLQVMKDVLYGMEYQDAVILLDVLRYGLLEIYRYLQEEMQGGETE